MRIRQHTGGLSESLATTQDIPATAQAVADYFNKRWGAPVGWGDAVAPADIEVKPYCRDDRIGWDTHIVTWKQRHWGAVGFTDGPLEELPHD